MPGILVIGSINMDLVVRTPRVPERGETISGDAFHTFPGGKGANQAVAAARQGAVVAMAGCVGADAFGAALRDTLHRDGVDTAHVLVDAGVPTGVALVVLEESGDNRILVVAGANGLVSPALVDSAGPAFDGAQALVLQLEVPLPAVQHAATRARTHDIPVILNAAPARPLPADLLALVDYLVVNEVEVAMLAGQAPGRPAESAAALRAQGVSHVVVTLGAGGATYYGEGTPIIVPAFHVPVLDTTAAGDAFVGAFAVALVEGALWPPRFAAAMRPAPWPARAWALSPHCPPAPRRTRSWTPTRDEDYGEFAVGKPAANIGESLPQQRRWDESAQGSSANMHGPSRNGDNRNAREVRNDAGRCAPGDGRMRWRGETGGRAAAGPSRAPGSPGAGSPARPPRRQAGASPVSPSGSPGRPA